MTEATLANIYDILVGYENPNDNENEAACAAAYQAQFGLTYPTIPE